MKFKKDLDGFGNFIIARGIAHHLDNSLKLTYVKDLC
jgi:hypothetical protein